MFLIDTNVLSEYGKGPTANAGVVRFFSHAQDNTLFLPVQVIGEIQAGISKLRRAGRAQALRQAEKYELWLDHVISHFSDRILKFDLEASRVWGSLLAGDKRDPHTIDKQIAAIALIHDLVVVTRDKGDAFSRTPNLKILNPFL
ncbi:type II toxin-antitoxin system VapC family toxin [Duganella sp. HH101]|uniref:type II toxin-antitoxin system VapC family toxin n=1 Tax=Duganella sp. HH101 TaxID=1781066 RepID=UPI00087569D2|nr:type II toxin-antitoxin system VapC family toxin [Duganella sp. HH101]OFA01165.1 tRNA(fMet)-specific endonuclease VapC [Duganella sp. HH101]